MEPEEMILEVNMKEFSTKVEYILCLEQKGSYTPLEAYYKIKEIWKQLKMSKRNLIHKTNDRTDT
jgi:hypothetical protein